MLKFRVGELEPAKPEHMGQMTPLQFQTQSLKRAPIFPRSTQKGESKTSALGTTVVSYTVTVSPSSRSQLGIVDHSLVSNQACSWRRVSTPPMFRKVQTAADRSSYVKLFTPFKSDRMPDSEHRGFVIPRLSSVCLRSG